MYSEYAERYSDAETEEGFSDSSLLLPMLLPAMLFFSIFCLFLLVRKMCFESILEQADAEEKAKIEAMEKNLIFHVWQKDRGVQTEKTVDGTSQVSEKNDESTTSNIRPDSCNANLDIEHNGDNHQHSDDSNDDKEKNDDSGNNDTEKVPRFQRVISKLQRLTEQIFMDMKMEESKEENEDEDESIEIDIVGGATGDSTKLGCAICLKAFRTGDMISESKNSSCQHMFHKECILLWLQKQNCCPLCKETYVLNLDKDNNTQKQP